MKKLLASDAAAGDEFGYSVAADADVIVVGRPITQAADPGAALAAIAAELA